MIDMRPLILVQATGHPLKQLHEIRKRFNGTMKRDLKLEQKQFMMIVCPAQGNNCGHERRGFALRGSVRIIMQTGAG